MSSKQDGVVDSEAQHGPHSPNEGSTTLNGWSLRVVCRVIGLVLVGLFMFALQLPLTLLSICFTGKTVLILDDLISKSKSNDLQGSQQNETIYTRNRREERAKRRKAMVERARVVWSTRVGMVVLLWLILNLSVPRLRGAQFLGPALWKWSVLLTFVFLLYPTMLSGIFIVHAGCVFEYTRGAHIISKRDYVEYWTRDVGSSVRWIIYFALILHVWLIYFIASMGEIRTKRRLRIDEYVTLTLVSLLVWAIMDLFRKIVNLQWKSIYVYTSENKVQILVAAFRLLLLLLIVGEEEDAVFPRLIPYYVRDRDKSWKTIEALNSPSPEAPSEQLPLKSPIERFMEKMSEVVSMREIHKVAKWLTNRLDMTSHQIPPDLQGSKFVQTFLNKYYRDERRIIENMGLHGDYLNFLLHLMRLDLEQQSPTNPTTSTMELPTRTEFENWMTSAHRRCFLYTSKLDANLELAKVLSKILIVLEVVATFIFWLFVTQLATTKCILTLGSLLLGLVFIFGDTCKAAFQGFIFACVLHPFDVGDNVEIESEQLEVHKIKFMETLFVKREASVDMPLRMVIYPNSKLATMKIVKLHSEGKSKTWIRLNKENSVILST